MDLLLGPSHRFRGQAIARSIAAEGVKAIADGVGLTTTARQRIVAIAMVRVETAPQSKRSPAKPVGRAGTTPPLGAAEVLPCMESRGRRSAHILPGRDWLEGLNSTPSEVSLPDMQLRLRHHRYLSHNVSDR